MTRAGAASDAVCTRTRDRVDFCLACLRCWSHLLLVRVISPVKFWVIVTDLLCVCTDWVGNVKNVRLDLRTPPEPETSQWHQTRQLPALAAYAVPTLPDRRGVVTTLRGLDNIG